MAKIWTAISRYSWDDLDCQDLGPRLPLLSLYSVISGCDGDPLCSRRLPAPLARFMALTSSESVRIAIGKVLIEISRLSSMSFVYMSKCHPVVLFLLLHRT